MQATYPLQHEVHGGWVGDHHVEIDIQALLNDLGGDHDVPTGTVGAVLAEEAQHLFVAFHPIAGQETRVQQRDLIGTEPLRQDVVGFLGGPDRVAYDDGAAAFSCFLPQEIRQGVLVYHIERDDSFGCVSTAPRDHLAVNGAALLAYGGDHRVPDVAVQAGIITQFAAGASAAVGGDEATPAIRRKRGREQHDGYLVQPEPSECCLQVHLHVGVGGVHLVDDHHLAHQPQVTHQDVSRFQGGQQHLIDRPDDDRRQGGAPSKRHPSAGQQAVLPAATRFVVVHLHGGLSPTEKREETLVEVVLAVRQVDADLLGAILQNGSQPSHGTGIHGIGGGLRRKGDHHPLQPAFPHQSLGGGEGQFGLSRSRRGLDDHEVRVAIVGDLDRSLLGPGRVHLGAPTEPVAIVVSGVRLLAPRGSHGGQHFRPRPSPLDSLPLFLRVQWLPAFLLGKEGEVVLVRREPIRHDDHRGIGGGHSDRQFGQRRFGTVLDGET